MIPSLVFVVLASPFLAGQSGITAELEYTLHNPGLIAPQSLACSPQGSIWVADQLGTRIHLFAPNGTPVRSFGGEGQGPCEFTDRISLADPGGLYLYAADTDGSRVIKMTRGGLCVKEIRPGGDAGFMSISRPTAMASQRGGRVYVGDAGTGSLMTLDLFDQLAELTGTAVSGSPLLVEPAGLACRKDSIYLSDGAREEVVLLDRFGNVLKRMPFAGTPGGIDCRSDGLLAIVDQTTEDVALFLGMEEVDRISNLMPNLSLSHPRDVCFGRGARLYIADAGNDRVVAITIRVRVNGGGAARD